MNWTWDDDKNKGNIQKHGVSSETAILTLDDPLSVTDDDPFPWEQRFRTVGAVGNTVLVVVHTLPEPDPSYDVEVGRIISARRATSHERRSYEAD